MIVFEKTFDYEKEALELILMLRKSLRAFIVFTIALGFASAGGAWAAFSVLEVLDCEKNKSIRGR